MIDACMQLFRQASYIFFSVFVVKEEKRREKQLCLTEISGSVDALDKLKQAVFFLLDFSVLLKLVAERERERELYPGFIM